MKQYCRCLLWSIGSHLQMINQQHPVYLFLKQNADFINEEPGEVILSRHSQSTVKFTDKGNLQNADCNFKYLGVVAGTSDVSIKNRKKSHVIVNPKQQKVKTLGNYK